MTPSFSLCFLTCSTSFFSRYFILNHLKIRLILSLIIFFMLFLFPFHKYQHQDLVWSMSKVGEGNAPHSSTLAWKIPWMEEPGGLQSMRSLRVGHDWATSLSLFTFTHWRGKWHPTPVFLPGESQGQGSLVSFHLWGRTESDTTEVT